MASLLRRLTAMGLAEVTGRVGQALDLAIERQRFQRATLAAPDRLRRAVAAPYRQSWPDGLLESQRAIDRPLFMGPRARGELRELFASRYQAEGDVARAWASQAASGTFAFFGRTHRLGLTPDWHADPVTGRQWPRGFHGDAEAATPAGADVKDVWELNRHQFLVDLAKHDFLCDDDGSWRALRGLVSHWLDTVPYATGIPWACALEPAYRALAWLWASWLSRDRLAADPAFHLRWCEGLYDHGRFLHTHLERYSSPYNHLIGEAAVLYLVGLALPEVEEARAWRERGRAVLVNTLSMQFHPDGGSVEQATFYHHATLGFYLLAAVAGRHAGDEWPDEVWAAIERGIEYSMWLTQPDGRVPAIGDTDDAKSLFLERRPFWDFRHFLAVGAVLHERRDFRAQAGAFWEDALWLLGPAALRRFDGMEGATPTSSARCFEHSGIAIVRSGWAPDDDFVYVDVGEQSGGLRHDELPSAAHGHADALSIVASFGGRPVLIDAGFFTYNGDRAWERHFRETAAHNTVAVDQRDQAVHLQKMAWSHAPRVSLHTWANDEAGARVVASHDGYARGPSPVTHRRLVWRRPSGVVVIVDKLSGSPPHDIALHYQLAADLDAELSPDGLTVASQWQVVFRGTAPLSPRLMRGQPEPAGGWVADSLGVRRPAARLALLASMQQPVELFVTALARTDQDVAVSDGPAASLTVRLDTAEGTDSLHVTEGNVTLTTTIPPGPAAQTVTLT